MKKRVLHISVITFSIALTAFFAVYLFPRLFSDYEKKMLFDMRNLVNMHINPKNYCLSDINTHYFTCGLYEKKQDGEYYYLSINTEEDFYNVTKKLVTILEHEIIRNPEMWFWTHDRWKDGRRRFGGKKRR